MERPNLKLPVTDINSFYNLDGTINIDKYFYAAEKYMNYLKSGIEKLKFEARDIMSDAYDAGLNREEFELWYYEYYQ